MSAAASHDSAGVPRETVVSLLRYETGHFLASVGMALGWSLRVEGSRHVPRRGPALLVANHQSYLDPVAVGLGCPRRLYYLARKTLFRNHFFAWLIRGFNAVPIDQEMGKEGLQMVLRLLKAGRPVLVFPEGERTSTGQMQPLKAGIHLLLKRASAPVLPVGVAGAFHAWPRWRKYPSPAPLFCAPTPGTVAVSIGRPRESTALASLPREDALARLFDEMQIVVARAEKLRRQDHQ